MVGKINQSGNVRQLQLQNAAAFSKAGGSFDVMLQQEFDKNSGVQFSKHAAARITQRGIEMTETLMGDLNQAVEKAREKGSKNVAIISERGTFIVNVPNNTVVTTVSSQEMKHNIFTNIDSAVLV